MEVHGYAVRNFEKISQYFADTKLVYLSGWGEPLLKKRILDMVKLVTEGGVSVGFTTNGMLLTEKMCRRLIELELDILSVSIAGATKKTHESIRVGSDFSRLITNIRRLTDLKDSYRSEKPKTVLLLLMTKQNVSELPFAVRLAKDVGCSELVATNLAYVATPHHDELKTFSCQNPVEKFIGEIREAERRAKELGVTFRSYPSKMDEMFVCEEDPLNNLYISSDGYVSPCVYLNLPMKDVRRIFCGNSDTIQRTHFGNVNQTDLLEIWKGEYYRSFREKLKRRSAFLQDVFQFSISDFRRLEDWLKTNPLPEVCRTCYKAYGI